MADDSNAIDSDWGALGSAAAAAKTPAQILADAKAQYATKYGPSSSSSSSWTPPHDPSSYTPPRDPAKYAPPGSSATADPLATLRAQWEKKYGSSGSNSPLDWAAGVASQGLGMANQATQFAGTVQHTQEHVDQAAVDTSEAAKASSSALRSFTRGAAIVGVAVVGIGLTVVVLATRK